MKRLEEMNLAELWDLFPIILTEHNPQWRQWAEEEMSELMRLVSPLQVKIYHIGSTAVDGICAKPIIDLIVAVDSLDVFADIRHKLIGEGYLCMSEAPRRISFNKGYNPEGYAERVFHIHLRLIEDIDEVYFRDYLNGHKNIAKEYEALKLSLWKDFEHDRDGYTKAKTPFVRHYTSIAKEIINIP